VFVGFAIDRHPRQGDPAKRRQHHLRRWTCGLSARLSGGEACECRAVFLQMLPRDTLHQPQHAQGDAQQEEQPDDPRLTWQGEWRERQRAPFQAPHALLDQVFAPRSGDHLREVQRLLVVIGRVNAPASAPHGLCAMAA